MLKEKISLILRLKYCAREFGNDAFLYDSSVLISKYCEIKGNCEEIFNVMQHLKTEKYAISIKRQQEKPEKHNSNFLRVEAKNLLLIKMCVLISYLANIP